MEIETTIINESAPHQCDDAVQKIKIKKKRRGNRKMQRYRRKLRKQSMNQNTTPDMPHDNISVNKGTVNLCDQIQEKQEQATEIVEHETANPPLKPIKQKEEKKFKKQQIIVKKAKVIGSEYSSKRKIKEIPIIKDTFDYAKLPDAIFYQMYSTVFNENEDLAWLSNADEKIQFVRRYTSLIDRLSYVQLQEFQWKYYYDTGMTQHIWTHRCSKRHATKYSLDFTYGRSKRIIQQRLKQIEQHLQKSQNAVQEFQAEMYSKCTQSDNCISAMEKLFSIVHQFVQEKQKLLHFEHEYKREILILDATDHQLFQKFFDLEPNKSHKISAKCIWGATKEQMSIEENIAWLKHRLTTTTSSSSSSTQSIANILYHMIDNIDMIVAKSNETGQTSTMESNLTDEIPRLQLLKNDIIRQALNTSAGMIENLNGTIQTERNKFFVKNRYMESTSAWQETVLNAIDTRRNHMIERVNYIIGYKIKTIGLQ